MQIAECDRESGKADAHGHARRHTGWKPGATGGGCGTSRVPGIGTRPLYQRSELHNRRRQHSNNLEIRPSELTAEKGEV